MRVILNLFQDPSGQVSACINVMHSPQAWPEYTVGCRNKFGMTGCVIYSAC
jgi:hypothetical protein